MESAFLEVRRSNVAAEKLYEGLGFGVTGLRPMYYPDNMEDGLLMTKELRSAHTGD
jgi:ribosomal-protein-alanine N-acetyltransferase